MCPFFIIMRSCNILGTCTVHHSTKNDENFTEGVNSLASKTRYEHQSLKQNNILWVRFSSQPYFLFSRCGWVVCLPFFYDGLDAKNTVCCGKMPNDLNHIFFVMFKTDQKNANQLEILKFDWNFFQLHFDSRGRLFKGGLVLTLG